MQNPTVKRFLPTACLPIVCGMFGVAAPGAMAQDDSDLSVIVRPTTFAESAGKRAAYATLTRTGDTDVPLVVELSSSVASGDNPLNLPSRITIPAGATSQSFFIGAREDDVIDGNQTVTIDFDSAIGSTETLVTVTDSTPIISLSVLPQVVQEGRKNRDIVGTVSRSNLGRNALHLRLTSSDESQIKVPTTVVIPPGKRAVNFRIHVIDDRVVESEEQVTISARARASSAQLATTTLTVRDDDVAVAPRLSLEIRPRSLREDGGTRAGFGIIKINRLQSTPITFNLSSSDPTRLTVPAQVTLPAGKGLIVFPIAAIDNNIEEVDKTVTITVNALVGADALASSSTVRVRDDDGDSDDDDDNDGDDHGDGDDDDDDNGGQPDRPSTVRVSSLAVSAADDRLTLVFTGALSADSAQDDSRYNVRVRERELEVVDAVYNAATRTVTLELEDDVQPGDTIVLFARGLRDASGALLPPRALTIRVPQA